MQSLLHQGSSGPKSLKKFLKKLVYSKNKPNRSFIYFLPVLLQKCQVSTGPITIAYNLECRFLSFMPFSKNNLSTQSLRFLEISKDPYRQRIFITCIIR